MGSRPETGELVLNISTALISFLTAAVIFNTGWSVSSQTLWQFELFAEVNKADWSSRIVSTAHAVIVCSMVVATLVLTSFDPVSLVPIGSTALLEMTFSVSIGYFLFDLGVILWWMLPMWTVFLVHHFVALVPYVITQFFFKCSKGQYVLLLFLLVEASTMPLNSMAFLEDLGRRRSTAHRLSHGLMYSLWFVSRVLLPFYLLLLVWTKVFDGISSEETCLIPSMVCAHIIALFCIGVFFFILTPEIYSRARYGDKEDVGAETVQGRGARRIPPLSVSMEVFNTEDRGAGAAGGPYHDLDGMEGAASEGAVLPSPRRTIATVAMEGPQQMARAFREGLLPHGDDEGGAGHTGVEKTSAGQMR